jgi:nitroreductase
MQSQNGKIFSKKYAILICNFHDAGMTRYPWRYVWIKSADNQHDIDCVSVKDIFQQKKREMDLKKK